VGVVVVQDHSEAVALVNLLAPEHLEMLMEDFSALLSKVRNAGAIFLGRETSVVLGDYAAGTNHVLPTGTTSRFSSPLGVRDFQKSSNVVFSNHKANRKMAAVVRELSEAEGLPAHSKSLENRIS
jgi:histidinol dehydrogenase